MSAEPAERVPVIVGVGQANDRPDDPADGLNSLALMAEALELAQRDAAGAGGWLADCDALAVVGQISWPQINPVAAKLTARLGMAPAHVEETLPHGDSPVRMLSEAANRIGRGEAVICAIVGGEALRTAGQLAARTAGTAHDPLRHAAHRRRTGYAQTYGLTVPTDIYPLYENACRAAWGQSLAEGQAESGAIWAQMSAVAAVNPHAWLRQERTADEIVAPAERNRPVAFPYTKLQVANAAVNQGAGFIVTSLAEARRRKVPEDRLIFVGHGAGAHEPASILERPDFVSSASMELVLRAALDRNGLSADGLAAAELYSCFPCVPKMARRVIGWPVDRPVTVFGGLTFGGGPIGNYMSHAVAAMVEHLRGTDGCGLLFGNGGYATCNHALVLSGQSRDARFPQDFDVQAAADAARRPAPPVDEDYAGPAMLETWTVHYARDGNPRSATVVSRTPAGARTLALVPADDTVAIAALTGGLAEPVGSAGRITFDLAEGLARWRFA